ncbi:MAG: EAL domain-containing protein, partial [Alphaproteobacteria bacterium]|nr:EAL domain-containing protein [Alphaproteobacteria bacterium]
KKLRAGRLGVHLHLSRLAPPYRRRLFIKIATETFANSIQPFDGQLFTLENDDLFFLAKDTTATVLDAAINRLRVLFSDDPTVQNDDGSRESGFCVWYHVENEYESLLEIAHWLLEQAERNRAYPEIPPNIDPAGLMAPIQPELLAKLEQSLAKTDISNMVRRQNVCTLIEGQDPQPLFEEIFVSIEDLQSITTPGVDLLGNTWLFRALTQTLDRRMMSTLVRDGLNSARPFSLNLNIASVLSPEFMRFESFIAPQIRGRIVIELDKLDVFSDMGAFVFARDYLHDHGFRLCLDGLTHHTLPYYDRARLGVDLVKVYWTPNSIDHILPSLIPHIRNVVMETGQARTIMCRCDNERAVEMGRELGIVMFQGRQVDQILGGARYKAPTA